MLIWILLIFSLHPQVVLAAKMQLEPILILALLLANFTIVFELAEASF